MQTARLTALLSCSAILIGCQSTPSAPVQAPQSVAGRCNASAVQKLVGEQATPELLNQARRESGAVTARIIRPGDIVTLEYNSHRLTLTTDEALTIQQTSCG